MSKRGPNWGLAFGSGSFLLVWSLGFMANVPIEVVAVRATMATILGAMVGILFGQTVSGLRTMYKDGPKKGGKVDFTLPADDLELTVPPVLKDMPQASADKPGSAATAKVPAAPAPEAGFQPLDLKKAARHVETMIQE